MGELKNKLFKGLTEHDILTWEEGKMQYARKMGRKVTDLEFLRFLLMMNTSPRSTRTKDGVSTDTLLDRFRSHGSMNPAGTAERKPGQRRRL
jgi:hypothetical protein